MSVLEAKHLSKELATAAGPVAALKEFSANFESGKRYAIIGPSGCGKSTLLYLLGLLDTATSGEIAIDGQPVDAMNPMMVAHSRNEKIGFVFQFHFLLPELTVVENLMVPALKLGVPEADSKSRALELLERVGLRSKCDRLASELSGGEQQRVAVARALMNKPKLILADEPTGNLDAANSEAVFGLLSDTCAQQGTTLIMVTHNPELAAQCDYQLRLKDGILLS